MGFLVYAGFLCNNFSNHLNFLIQRHAKNAAGPGLAQSMMASAMGAAQLAAIKGDDVC